MGAAASLWIDRGVNMKRVQPWMGHSSIHVTSDTYGYLFDNPTRDAAVADAIERELTGAHEDAAWILPATRKPQFSEAF